MRANLVVIKSVDWKSILYTVEHFAVVLIRFYQQRTNERPIQMTFSTQDSSEVISVFNLFLTSFIVIKIKYTQQFSLCDALLA